VRLKYYLISYLQPSGTNKVMQDLGQQFRAALFSYDEGVQSSDIVLASSLWRRFYSTGHDFRPEEIELLVSYVRRQVINQWLIYQEIMMLKYFLLDIRAAQDKCRRLLQEAYIQMGSIKSVNIFKLNYIDQKKK
jgi:Ubiquinol-cytochrome C chaperone